MTKQVKISRPNAHNNKLSSQSARLEAILIRIMNEREYPHAGGLVKSSCDVRSHHTYWINRQIIRNNLQPLVIWGIGRTENFDKHL
jgi:hypothetical protein